MKRKGSDTSWKIPEALAALRAGIDPYIWEQGQELYRRGAVEDFQVAKDGSIHVIVLDPRDSRKFFVTVERDQDGRVRARCECPYRLGGRCRHQVVSLEYLRAMQAPPGEEAAPPVSAAPPPKASATPSAMPEAPAFREPEGSILYRLGGVLDGVKTAPDGSLLRVVLHSLGSLRAPHKLGLQLFTGTGWTELRTPDIERWIARGSSGPHPRDALLARIFLADGSVRREADAEVLASLLALAASSSAILVDRAGQPLGVSLLPWKLGARLERGRDSGLSVVLSCVPLEGDSVPLAEVTVVASVAPWIQLSSGVFHPLFARVPGPYVALLQDEDLEDLEGDALDRFLSEGLPILEALSPGGIETVEGLIEQVEGVTEARIRLEGEPGRLGGALEFSYGGDWIRAPDSPAPWTVEKEGRIHRYPPAGQALARAHRELGGLGFVESDGRWIAEGPGSLARLLAPRAHAFVTLVFPARIEALDLVHRAPVLELHVAAWRPPEDPEAARRRAGRGGGEAGPEGGGSEGGGARPRSSMGWLEVGATLLDGGRVIPLSLEVLDRAAKAAPGTFIELADGTVLDPRHEALSVLEELRSVSGRVDMEDGGARLRLPVARAVDLLEDRPGSRVEFAPDLRPLVADLEGSEASEPIELIPAIDGILRSYQRRAVEWFGRLSRWGLGGILADEMGLGKTIMALAHFFGGKAAAPDTGPVLVVCPSSLVFNWLAECRRFLPEVRARGLHGLGAEERAAALAEGADLLVTSYALLRRDREVLESRDFRAVVLDEAQNIKNAESQTAQAAFALRARERWALTGTPIENHLGELWSIFRFLVPGLLGSEREFQDRYALPIARREEDVLARLRGRLSPFILRRTKAQVLSELPPKIVQVEGVPLTEIQRALYLAALERARGDLGGADSAKARFQILAAITRLRQICCDPRLVLSAEETARLGERGAEAAGGKLLLLRELLETLLEEGHRVLVYSQFTSMLDLIEEMLVGMGIEHCRLDGATRDREGVVRRFASEPTLAVFLISLKAGGLGLNLTQADTVILYDPWWNPAAEEQAASRAHRMGQTVPVHVHKLVALGTVEEKILLLQSSKRELASSLLDASVEALDSLGIEDLRRLLLED